MKEHIFLKILDKIKSIYISMGVDYEKMRLILKYKLTMDSRRTSTLASGNISEGKEKNYFIISLIIYAFMGLFIGIITFMPINKMYIYNDFCFVYVFSINCLYFRFFYCIT